MPIPLTDVVYPLDESGQSPSNRIVNERHELTSASWSGFNLIIPYAAPFFDDSIEYLIHYPSGDRLERGRDWITGYLFQSCSGELGKFVSSCIYFFDTQLEGQVEIPSYQCLGGEWQVSREQMTKILAEALLNPQRYYWEYVAELPQIYRPIDHDQDIDEFSELGELLDELRGIANAIRDTPWATTLQAHMIQRNPHGTTKDDVDLGLVPNYRVANPTDLTDPQNLPAEFFMNPPMVKLLIDNIAVSALDAFKARRDNPNVVTANQTGALTAAQTEQLIAEMLTGSTSGNIDAGFLSGHTYQDILDAAMASMENSLDETKNEMLAQLSSILAGFQADDTMRFAGKTESEWDARIVQMARTSQPTRRFDAIMDVVNNPDLNLINIVTAAEVTHTLIATITPVTPAVKAPTWAFQLSFAGHMVEVVLKQDLSGGHCASVYDNGLELPSTWKFFLDDGNDGTRRLWLTAPANRPAIDIFNMGSDGVVMGDGQTFYGASSANPFSHPNRVDLVSVQLSSKAWVEDLVEDTKDDVLDDMNGPFRNGLRNDILSEVSNMISGITSTAGQYTWIEIEKTGGTPFIISDLDIAKALHATGMFGNAYNYTTTPARLTDFWNDKPHSPETLRVETLRFAGTDDRDLVYPSDKFADVLDYKNHDFVEERVKLTGVSGSHYMFRIGIARSIVISRPNGVIEYTPSRPTGIDAVLGNMEARFVSKSVTNSEFFGGGSGTLYGFVSADSDEYTEFTHSVYPQGTPDQSTLYWPAKYMVFAGAAGANNIGILKFKPGVDLTGISGVTITIRRGSSMNPPNAVLVNGHYDPDYPDCLIFEVESIYSIGEIAGNLTSNIYVS